MKCLKNFLFIIAIFGTVVTSEAQSTDPKPSKEKPDKPLRQGDTSTNDDGNYRSEGLTKIFSGTDGDEEEDCDCEVNIDLDMNMDIDIDLELENEINIEVNDVDVEIDEQVEVEIDNDFDFEMNSEEEIDEPEIIDNETRDEVDSKNDHAKFESDIDHSQDKRDEIEKNKIKSKDKVKPGKSAGLRKIN